MIWNVGEKWFIPLTIAFMCLVGLFLVGIFVLIWGSAMLAFKIMLTSLVLMFLLGWFMSAVKKIVGEAVDGYINKPNRVPNSKFQERLEALLEKQKDKDLN